MIKKLSIFTIFLCTFFGAQNSFADQLVTNGGFETGDLTGWTVMGAATASSFASDFYGVNMQNAATGTYGAYLGSEFSTLTLSQTLTVQPANYYTVSFSLAQDEAPSPSPLPSANYINSFVVELGSGTVFSETNAPVSGYTNYSFTVSTSPTQPSSDVLQIISENDLGLFSLDNVSVSTGAATPGPGSLLLIAPAFGLLALLRRKAA